MGGYANARVTALQYIRTHRRSFCPVVTTSTAFQKQPRRESSEACLYLLFCLAGMGAISAAVLSSVGSGDVVITQHDVYGGTIGFLKSDLPRFGATVLFEDTNNLKHLEKLLFGRETVSLSGTLGTSGKEDSSRVSNADEEQCPIGERCSEEPTVREGFVNGGTHREASSRDRGVEASTSGSPACGGLVADVRGKGGRVLIFVETVSNPLLVVSDVRAIAALSKRAGALLIVDNTFGTPLRSRPLSEVRNRRTSFHFRLQAERSLMMGFLRFRKLWKPKWSIFAYRLKWLLSLCFANSRSPETI